MQSFCKIRAGINGNESEFKLEKRFSWRKISYITADKTYLYSEPSEKRKLKFHLKKYDCVAILGEKGNWTKIQYISKKLIIIRFYLLFIK